MTSQMLNVVSSKARGEASMSAKNGSIKLIAGNSNPELAQAIADGIGVPLTKGVVRRFADMEIFVEIHEKVRGSDAFILQSTSFSANDQLMELLINGLLKQGARRSVWTFSSPTQTVCRFPNNVGARDDCVFAAPA